MFEFGIIQDDGDASALTQLAQQTFNFPASYYAEWFERLGANAYRVIRKQGKIVAGLAIYEAGQWFGGQPVTMGGIAMVCVDPTQRRQGVGRQLLAATLHDLRDRGTALSTLFPSTLRAYRRLGFEQAGSWYTQTHPLLPPHDQTDRLPMRQVDKLRPEEFDELAERRARRTEGNLQRSQTHWQRLFDPRGNPTPVRGYLLGDKEDQGYLIYLQEKLAGVDRIVIKDMTAETPLAANTLWSFLHGHGTTVDNCVWSGPAVDPLLMATTECDPKILNARRWMSRVVDVKRALESRGYRCPHSRSLDLEVVDEALPENSGRYTLNIENGRGTLKTGGPGTLKMDARGLASLYTGFCSAYDLQIAGRVDAPAEILQVADQIFVGTSPWMPDYF